MIRAVTVRWSLKNKAFAWVTISQSCRNGSGMMIDGNLFVHHWITTPPSLGNDVKRGQTILEFFRARLAASLQPDTRHWSMSTPTTLSSISFRMDSSARLVSKKWHTSEKKRHCHQYF
ncbi:hypothetical protein M433DRAFT_378199 [Acidomyces richmondensis BFW]|nr:MAG: hypothetical protein FE78DRAFT_518400 [Acidomyces sp. 'richmondensis']KYG43001.1 hypothetical protein M433DRAFT_378199 [Acidomyces richmondensis BFW]